MQGADGQGADGHPEDKYQETVRPAQGVRLDAHEIGALAIARAV